MITLTDAERDKFAAYCRQEAASSKGIVEQFLKAGGPVMETLAQRERLLVAAHTVVADRLLTGERVTIGGPT